LDGPTPGSDPAFRARETDLPCEGGERNKGLRGNEWRAKPATYAPHTNFESQVCGFPSEEGGRHRGAAHPSSTATSPSPSARPTLPATTHLPGGIEMVMPGSNVEMTVD
jgi:elongation factor Tu